MIDGQNNIRPKIKMIHNIWTVDAIIYLGTTVSNKARESVIKLTEVWKRLHTSLNTTVRLVRILLFSVILYGSECWQFRYVYIAGAE